MNSLSAEDKAVGRDNYYTALEQNLSRREFLAGAVGAGVASGTGLGAMYFGYGKSVGDPVRVGVIGTGDEGNVLIGALNPDYVEVKAICDIRPFNIHRAFYGDWASPAAWAARNGLNHVYGWKSRDEAEKHVKVFQDYKELLKDPDIEAVIIALPLHLHHDAAMDALAAGKHVLTEKLMAHDVGQCKEMARMSKKTGLLLATGHQRHYSVLYDNAVELIRWGLLGQIHHIRAQWHRGNLPGSDSWKQPLPGGEEFVNAKGEKGVYDKIADQLKSFKRQLDKATSPSEIDVLEKKIAQWAAWNSDKDVDAAAYDYQDITLPNGRRRSAMEELCRWRLWDRTGGGLMAELGSHQLDAASIFISALSKEGKKAKPLSVTAIGGRHVFPLDRDCDDHVYCVYEFPGPAYEPAADEKMARAKYGYFDKVEQCPSPKDGILSYDKDPEHKIVVTYSSINGNGFGGYGEVVMGSKGTLILEREQEVMLYKDSSTSTTVSVKNDAGGPTMDTQASGAPGGGVAKAAAETAGPVSRGYREEIEHWAWCIRNPDPANQPRCKPEVAMADAIIALTSNVAIRENARIEFQQEWFDVDSDATPDGSQPKSVS